MIAAQIPKRASKQGRKRAGGGGKDEGMQESKKSDSMALTLKMVCFVVCMYVCWLERGSMNGKGK